MTFSIILATYNGERFIRQQMDSILNQAFGDFELLIQDDCSKDKTVTILKEYVANDSRIKLFINENNLGYTRNFLSLLCKATGKYIVLSDQDDVWTNDRLSYTKSFFEKHNDIGLLVSNDICFNEILPKIENKKQKNGYYYSDFLDVLWSCSYKGCDMAFRKSYSDKMLTIFSKKQDIIAHDWFILTYFYLYSRIAVDSKVLLFHRMHGDNTSLKEITGLSARQSRISGIDKQLKHIYWFENTFKNRLKLSDKKLLKSYIYMMEQRKKILASKKYYYRYIPLLLRWQSNMKIEKRLIGDIIKTVCKG